ncbi:hypothetical protein [Kocuria carniphila]|uniref:hypothetical protein n=1 Tax=Kocuria carniphila TaxID=262208 RepID=UPI0028EEF068|nr:hypothetical protein [Kocuria carniphila]
MKTPNLAHPHARRRIVILIAATAVLLLLAGLGVYGLARGPHPHTVLESPTPATGPSAFPTTSPDSPGAPALPTVAASDDPETFARNVAHTLFTWDTASGFMPLDYTAAVLEVADPTGEEQAGLASDIAAYLPSRGAWHQLRQYATAQTLTVSEARIPAAWDEAVAQAQPGQLTPGTVAVTIEGTRHRTGTWESEPVESEYQVAFTVFLVCGPTYDTCHLLRLSQLDNPLH